MKYLKSVFNFYLNSSIQVSLSVCGFIGVTSLTYNLPVSEYLLGFAFFGTITGYNFVKYAEVARLKHRSLNLPLKTIQVFSFFSFLALAYFTFKISFHTILATGGFALLTFFYAIPFLKNKNLRALTGIKILLVAVVWSGVTLLLPMINKNEILTNNVWIGFVQRIVFVFVLTLPFEIRDLKYDASALGTLPQRVGVRSTKKIGILLLTLALLIEFIKPEINLNYTISLIIICGILGVALLVSEKNQSKYFASFWVENIPVFWFGILYVIQNYLFISF